MEPSITINGVELCEGEALTVRVAIGSFILVCKQQNALGSDEHGQLMQTAYLHRLHDIVALMQRSEPPHQP